MWEISKNKNGTWHVDTEAAQDEEYYDATGDYESKQAAIEAATLHGDSFIIIDS